MGTLFGHTVIDSNMSDTNTETQDATSQDKSAKKPEGSEATVTQHEPTAYMTKKNRVDGAVGVYPHATSQLRLVSSESR